jgi:hypothetical protein
LLDPERLYVDAAKLDLIGRMEGALYTRTRDKFEPSVELGQTLLRGTSDRSGVPVA